MLDVLLLAIFWLTPLQQKPAADEASPIVAVAFRWFKDRQSAERVVLPARSPQPAMIEPNQSIGRDKRTDGTKPEPDPNVNKVESRSAALDQIAQQSSESLRVDGFTYEVRFKNLDAKPAQTIFWEYQFNESAHPENRSRHRFVCGVKIKPDKEKVVQVFSTLPPSAVVNLRNLAKGSGKQFDESVVIDRIEYEDGSAWQRKDWNVEQAKLTLTARRDQSGTCRSF